jgi:hypothetical protein
MFHQLPLSMRHRCNERRIICCAGPRLRRLGGCNMIKGVLRHSTLPARLSPFIAARRRSPGKVTGTFGAGVAVAGALSAEIDLIRRRTCFLWDPTLTAGPAANRHPTSTLRHHIHTLCPTALPTHARHPQPHTHTAMALKRINKELTDLGRYVAPPKASHAARTTACHCGAPCREHGHRGLHHHLAGTFG